MKKAVVFSALVFQLLLGSCGGEGTPTTPTSTPTPVATSITLSVTNFSLSVASLGVTSHQLYTTVIDQNGATMFGAVVAWATSDAAVATVSSAGLVTSVDDGTATITATSGSLHATASVTVAQVAVLQLLTEWGNVTENNVITEGIFAVWWDKTFDTRTHAEAAMADLQAIRDVSLNELGLRDPPNPGLGSYYNVYIHQGGPGNDNYPDSWGAGQGTDGFGRPYLTLPVDPGERVDPILLYHEGFHVFQYSANSPGFDYASDTGWFVEASANWFAATSNADLDIAHVEAGALAAVPFQALWHSWDNWAVGDPDNWNRLVRQYAMGTYLYYLTSVEGVATNLIVDGFYAGTDQSPQEYLFRRVGDLRSYFANFAAHTLTEIDYVSRAQYDRAMFELEEQAGDTTDIHRFVADLTGTGTAGDWFEPPAAQTPRGWSFNTIRIQDPQAGEYTIEFDGDDAGSEGAAAYFVARAVIRAASGDTFQTLALTDGRDGTWTLDASATDQSVYLIFAAVPEHFSGNQTYGYRLRVGPPATPAEEN
jgi:hypothetical protein